MLIFSRKRNESICIDDDVVVTVLGIWANKVRLGVEAPKKVVVHRNEVYQKLANIECLRQQPP